jgi:hypothetical protein
VSDNKRAVRIIQTDGSIGWTSRKSAERYIARGLAHERPDGCLAFIADDHRVVSAHQGKGRPLYGNGDGFATLEAVEGLPVAGPAIRLFTGHRPVSPPRDYPEPVILARRRLSVQELQ